MHAKPFRCCSRCGRELPTIEFDRKFKPSGARGGYQEWCRECFTGIQDRRTYRTTPIPHPSDPNAALVPLTRGMFATIDADMADEVCLHQWRAQRGKRTFYAVRTAYLDGHTQTIVWLHKVVAGLPDDVPIDHENGDGLDCRRANLRAADAVTNGHNKRLARNNTSGFKGVKKASYRGRVRWRAMLTFDRRRMHLGYFETAEEAARAYDEAARSALGEFAAVNFPAADERGAREAM